MNIWNLAIFGGIIGYEMLHIFFPKEVLALFGYPDSAIETIGGMLATVESAHKDFVAYVELALLLLRAQRHGTGGGKRVADAGCNPHGIFGHLVCPGGFVEFAVAGGQPLEESRRCKH